MANQSLLTYNAKVTQIEQLYYAPSATLPLTSEPISSIYVFLSQSSGWPDDNNPPVPTQDQKYIKNIFANMFVAKKVLANNISPVAQRIDWTSGTVYQYYRDDIDMFEIDSNGFLINNFYVKNHYDQVFKCLWNAKGAPSTKEPYFKPGNFGATNIFQDEDGYKWKYLYTIDAGSKKTFMDSYWMPVPIGYNTPNPLNTVGRGNIDVINVVNGGSGYDPANTTIILKVTGDGINAEATPTIANGIITDVIVTNTGSDYTYANVSITTTSGSGASFVVPASPIGGHGFDPVSELGCSRAMISVEFNGSENGYIPTDINYSQVGVLINPTSLSNYPYAANSNIYKTTNDLIVASGFGSYVPNEVVYQGPTLALATFTATVLSFDENTNVVRLINKQGNASTDATLYGNSSGTARTLLTISTPDFVSYSGYLSQVQNRSAIQRSSDGIEQFKFVLGY
jgi:hypothetical protein